MEQQTESLRLLFLSSALGPLGSGLGGGVEFKIKNLAQEMTRRGHQVTVAAVTGSKLAHGTLVEVDGSVQTNAFALGRQSPITMPTAPAQANILDYARQVQSEYDVIISFAYEWLPLYLTPFFETPLAHFISLPSLMDFMDDILCQIAIQYPYRLAVNTAAQADTYSFGDLCQIVGSGVDLAAYDFQPTPQNQLAWVARITPEKGLEDVTRIT
ncbi:MAG: glycosyltransferase family 4 protein [Okeania sp. SIO3B3]|nr:glycosyltransferase family 4 protein [Okeania sp. SIO3B3]